MQSFVTPYFEDDDVGYESGLDLRSLESADQGPSSENLLAIKFEQIITSEPPERTLTLKGKIKKLFLIGFGKHESFPKSSDVQPVHHVPLIPYEAHDDSQDPSDSEEILMFVTEETRDSLISDHNLRPAVGIERKKRSKRENAANGLWKTSEEGQELRKSKGKAVLSDSEASKRPQTFNSKRRLKHRGFIKADGEELEEALKRWVSVNAERVMKSKEAVKLHGTRRVHQESEYAKYAESLIHASLMTYLH